MSTHHIEITLSQDGKLMLDELPFRAGDKVEVIILAQQPKRNGDEYSLRGKPIEYLDPTDPVAPDDWEANQ
ncbi:MAG TPA: hypothetical protein VGN90_17410 [Pyrinomonadaceae bacterium]|jgi:hypothetical protein|nr:hypothetical protein [Pyrinomonadaceae bacterium]